MGVVEPGSPKSPAVARLDALDEFDDANLACRYRKDLQAFWPMYYETLGQATTCAIFDAMGFDAGNWFADFSESGVSESIIRSDVRNPQNVAALIAEIEKLDRDDAIALERRLAVWSEGQGARARLAQLAETGGITFGDETQIGYVRAVEAMETEFGPEQVLAVAAIPTHEPEPLAAAA